MANMELIEVKTLASAVASVTFSTIPQTYTDLKIVFSARNTTTENGVLLSFNGSSANLTNLRLYASGSSIASFSGSDLFAYGVRSDHTASTFGNTEIYIPNYTSSTYKSVLIDNANERDAASSEMALIAGLWSNTANITSIGLASTGAGTFAQHTTFYLYGISNVTSGSKATGGVVSSDGTYWYHMFPFSSTFTPTAALTNVDYLVIAGGGGAGQAPGSSGTYSSAGGGAGGLRSTVDATGRGGTLESKISLNSGTVYTITVGAGGNAGSSGGATNGGNSSIAGTGLTTITSLGGGAGFYSAANVGNGGVGDGGSGGGQSAENYLGSTKGLGTAGQGYDGGSGNAGSTISGSGGGAGSAGAFNSNGGNGVQIPSMANATQTGINTYYAGGGASGSATTRFGGLGGGGNQDSSGVVNTGGGGGGKQGSGLGSTSSGAGGSGIVIIRYAI